MSPEQIEKDRRDAAALLRQQLDRCQYGKEITREQEAFAKANGLVVVFGYSDDNVELRGAIDEEVGAFDGTTLRITPLGMLPDWGSFHGSTDDETEYARYFAKKASGVATIDAKFAPEDRPGYTWGFATSIPHLLFLVMEGEGVFGEGIVFHMDDVARAAA